MRVWLAGLLLLVLGAASLPADAQAPKLSAGFATAAKAYYEQIRALEMNAAVEMSRDDSRAYDRARQVVTAAQATDADRAVMSLLRQYSILVTRWRAMVLEAGRTDFTQSPERAQRHATCRHEIDRSVTTGELFQNAKCSAATR